MINAKLKCLVTGATGFLGTNLVHELVEQGWQVRASGAPGSETKYIDQLPIEVVLADITNSAEVDKLVEGCDVVFHVAGDTSFWKKFRRRQHRINVNGATNVAEACKNHGVKCLVHTSTLDVLGYNPTGGSYDEETGHYNFYGMGYHYGDTKLEAEIRVRAYNSDELKVVIINPGFMVGPFDYTLQIGRVFFDLKEGNMPASPPGGGSFCHVREVARAHVAAVEFGNAGERYLCAGSVETNMPYHQFFTMMAESINSSPPRITLPSSAFVAYGYLSEFWSEFTNKPPAMNPGQARYLSKPQYAISAKASRELGYVVPSAEECIADALEWYRDNGFDL